MDSVYSPPRCFRAIKSIKSIECPSNPGGASAGRAGGSAPRAEGEHHPRSCRAWGAQSSRSEGSRLGQAPAVLPGAAAPPAPAHPALHCPGAVQPPQPRVSPIPGAGAAHLGVPGLAGLREPCWARGGSGALPGDARRCRGLRGRAKGCRGDVGRVQRCWSDAGAASRQPRGCQVTLGVPGGCRGDAR